MGYYDEKESVEEYIRMAEGYDGRFLIDRLTNYLSPGTSVLELGMGPGKDQQLLQRSFKPTGSDRSKLFVERYLKQHPDADVMHLDAISLDTERRFDAIYSNKVLQHLTIPEMSRSLESQHRVLKEGGIVMHSLWHGEELEQYGEMLAQHYTLDSFVKLIRGTFEVLEAEQYTEMEKNDSLYVLLKKS